MGAFQGRVGGPNRTSHNLRIVSRNRFVPLNSQINFANMVKNQITRVCLFPEVPGPSIFNKMGSASKGSSFKRLLGDCEGCWGWLVDSPFFVSGRGVLSSSVFMVS